MILDFITGTESGIFLGQKNDQQIKNQTIFAYKSLLHNVDLCIFAVFEVEYVG